MKKTYLKKINNVFIVSATIMLLNSVLYANEPESAFYIPKTISPQAQEVMRGFKRYTISMPPVDDLKAWKTIVQQNEALWQSSNELAVKTYKPTLKRYKINGIPVIDIKPKGYKDDGKLLIYVHGGAYTFFSANSTLGSAVPIADETGYRIISIDYTLAPEAKHEQIMDEIIAVFKNLYKDGYNAENMAIYGDSAGGGLAAGVTLKMRDMGMPMPSAVVLLSPWSDINEIGDSYHTLKDADPLLTYKNSLGVDALAYTDVKNMKNPYVSPVYGDYKKGFPPVLIQGGTKEIFLSNFIRHYRVLDNAGIDVKLDLYEGMWHVFQAFHWNLPESQLARKNMSKFLKQKL